MSVALDVSAVACWVFASERTAVSEENLRRVARAGAVVPALWIFELLNVLHGAEKSGRLTGGELSGLLDRLRALPIEIEPSPSLRMAARLLELARSQRLTAYDAAYLELAERRALPLMTKDQQLVLAGARVGVELLPA